MAAAATRAVSTLASLQTAHATLQESIQEALEAQQQFLEHLAESTDGKAAADENRQAMLQGQLEGIKSYARMGQVVDDELRALEAVKQAIRENNPAAYGEHYHTVKEKLATKWDDNKILLSKPVRKAVTTMESAGLADEAMQEAESALLDEDGLLMSQAEESFLDPFTQQEMQDPVKSKTCGHSYESTSIRTYLRRPQHKRNGMRCPVPGCPNKKVTASDLVPNLELKKRIADANKQGKGKGKGKRKRGQQEEEGGVELL